MNSSASSLSKLAAKAAEAKEPKETARSVSHLSNKCSEINKHFVSRAKQNVANKRKQERENLPLETRTFDRQWITQQRHHQTPNKPTPPTAKSAPFTTTTP